MKNKAILKTSYLKVLLTENDYDWDELRNGSIIIYPDVIQYKSKQHNFTESDYGVKRPSWESIPKGCMYCNCGTMLDTQQQTRENWQAGHFDYTREAQENMYNARMAKYENEKNK